jgi:hypothetical protein
VMANFFAQGFDLFFEGLLWQIFGRARHREDYRREAGSLESELQSGRRNHADS